MFGYVNINKGELKVKDYEKYHAMYCGLCHSLKKRYGLIGQVTLTYDMTFVAMLLTSLYEEKSVCVKEHCIVHPFGTHRADTNIYTDYCADMNILLAYYKCLDDWQDERDIKALLLAALMKRKCKKAVKQNPRQAKAIREYIVENRECEEAGEKDIDKVAGCTGRMLAQLLCYREDEWKEYLIQLGFFLGKFIYILDAYDDLEKDIKVGDYNVLRQFTKYGSSEKKDVSRESLYEEIYTENFKKDVHGMLLMMAAGATAGFEKLPILENVDILRNILYSGIWRGYNSRNERKGSRREKSI